MKHFTLAVVCVGLMAATALGDWTEDFQSYAVGSLITGQGGWSGWDGDLTFLAEVANDPAGTAGNQVLKEFAGNDMVQQYTGYTSGAWVYKAKQYIPISQKGVGSTSFILMNNYNVGGTKGWGLQLNANLTLDLVFDAEGGYAPVPVVYDQWMEIRVEIDLDHNVRTTYYGGTLVGSGPWYDPADPTNHAKSIAAVDLWADAAGNPIYYDDLSITPGTPITVPTDDITTIGTVEGRYLVNLGQGYGDTVEYGVGWPTGLYEITNSGGNQQAWWRINDGDPHGNSVMVTFGGSNPDFFGYRFKLPATVNKLIWWNHAGFGDGGTFAATPDLQYLDAVNGTWQTISGVTWDRPYVTTYGSGVRRYVVTLNTPIQHAWGIRLVGNASESPQPGSVAAVDDDGDTIPGAGFVGVTEMTLYGKVEVGSLDLSNNLALASKGGVPVARACQQGADGINRINDGLFVASGDSYGTASPTGEDFIGVTWATPQNNVAAVGMTFAGFKDGGYFGNSLCGVEPNFRVEYTVDGTTWTAVTGLDKGRYSADERKLMSLQWGPDTAFLFRFNPVSGITGIRIIGDPDGFTTGDGDGFLGWLEFEVFANSSSGAKAQAAATRSTPSLSGLVAKVVEQMRTSTLF